MRTKWVCPICNKAITFETLFEDVFFESILNESTDPEQTEIEILADANWRVVQTKKPIEEEVTDLTACNITETNKAYYANWPHSWKANDSKQETDFLEKVFDPDGFGDFEDSLSQKNSSNWDLALDYRYELDKRGEMHSLDLFQPNTIASEKSAINASFSNINSSSNANQPISKTSSVLQPSQPFQNKGLPRGQEGPNSSSNAFTPLPPQTGMVMRSFSDSSLQKHSPTTNSANNGTNTNNNTNGYHLSQSSAPNYPKNLSSSNSSSQFMEFNSLKNDDLNTK